jgi:hypothetical protein
MNNFPKYLLPNQKSDFTPHLHEYYLQKLRENIFLMILKGDENEFFDLDTFNRLNINDMSLTKSLSDQIVTELESLGWKTKYSYGDTALFIYSTSDPPIGAW